MSETRARSEFGDSARPAAPAEAGAAGLIGAVAGVLGIALAVVAVVVLAVRRRARAKEAAETDAALRRMVVMDGSGAGPLLCDFIGGAAQVRQQVAPTPMDSGASSRPGRRQRGGSKLMSTIDAFNEINSSSERTDFSDIDLTDSLISVCVAA